MIPGELSFQSIYFPPLFFAVVLGFVCAWLSAKLLNLTGASRFFWHPGLAFLALGVLLFILAWLDRHSTLGAINVCSRHGQRIRFSTGNFRARRSRIAGIDREVKEMSQAPPTSRERADREISSRIAAFVPCLDTAKIAYGVKLALAILIAVWVELWFDLGMPDSAAICVLVIKSNVLGTTIQKSILRMIGNLIGCSIGLVFLALFTQDRIAGTVVFSLYSVFCCFFLQRSRYAPAWHWIYDSAAIVSLFHLGSATGSFIFTVERWLELSIGIVSMTLVSSILWPRRAGTVFEHKFLSMLKDLTAAVASLRRTLTSVDAPSPASTPEMLAASISALRNQLDTASRDTSRYERFHDGYQSLLDELRSLIARTTRLSDSVSQLTGAAVSPDQRAHFNLVADAIDQLKAAMDALAEYAQLHFDDPSSLTDPPEVRTIRAATERIRSSVTPTDYSLRDAAATLYVCETTVSVADGIERFSNALVHAEQKKSTQARLSAIQPLDSDHTPFWKRLDVRKSLVCGLTVALAFTVWMITDWPAGTVGIFFAVLITSKNCTAPYLPPKALIPGAIVGILVGSVIYFSVLPKLDGFFQLAIILFPFCVVGGYLMLSSNVKVAGVAGLTTIIAIKLMDLQAQQTFSFSHVIGFSYGMLGGTILAFIVLTVMWPIVPEKMFSGQVKAIFRSCRQWLTAVSTDAGTSAASRAAFARESAKQHGLFLMWSKFLSYDRLPAGSRSTVTRLSAAIQSTILHLIELDRMRHAQDTASYSTSLAGIAGRLDQELCKVLDRLVDSLEQCKPVPQLPDSEGLLEGLHHAFDEVCEGIGDKSERRDAACHILTMIGQYGALLKAVAECHAQLQELDWRSLNQSHF